MEGSKTRQNLFGYHPGLDGLRGLAVLAVIVYHANKTWLFGGFLGVEVFFVLSGYLITSLIVAESERTGRLDLKGFWLRRARRLLPALWVLLVAVPLYAAVVRPEVLGTLRRDLVAAFLYVFNWFQIWVGTSYFTKFDFVPLRHLWSLAVEEQFYFLWPLVMVGALRLGRRSPRGVALGFALVAVAVSVFVGAVFRPGPIGTVAQTPEQYLHVLGHPISRLDLLFLGTISRAGGLLLGAALAMVWRPWTLERPDGARVGRALDASFLAGMVALAAMLVGMHEVVEGKDIGTVGYAPLFRGGFFAVGLASLVVIATAVHPASTLAPRALGNRVLVWIGQRSYGLYLYHWPIFQFHRRFAGVGLGWAEFTALVALTAVLAEVSFRWLETPLRHGALGAAWARWRSGRRRVREVVVAVAAVALIGAAVDRVARAQPVVNDISQSLIDNAESVVDLAGEPDGTEEEVDALPAAATARAGSDAARGEPALAPAGVEVVALGDSVMLGAAGELRKRGILPDAKENRYVPEGAAILRKMKAVRRLTPVVVLHLGTNNSTTPEMLERLMKPLADVPLVLVLTLHIPHERKREVENNALIRGLPDRYPNVRIVDWSAAAKQHPEYFFEDGTHLRAEGRPAYADLIVRAIPVPVVMDPARRFKSW